MHFLVGLTMLVSATVTLAQLQKAPTVLVVDGETVTLKSVMWRDFMPTMPPVKNGQPLTAVLSAPSVVRIEEAWFIHGREVWKPVKLEEQDLKDPTLRNQPDSPVFRVIARGGPKWGPEIRIDIVARVKDRNGRTYLIRAEKQGIGRAD